MKNHGYLITMTTRHLRPACGSWNHHGLLVMDQTHTRLHKRWFLFGWLVGWILSFVLTFFCCYCLFNLFNHPNKTVREVLG